MEHNMMLLEEPFELMRAGKKLMEVRLFDKKRQKVGLGDTITFVKLPECKETLKVKVLGLWKYPSFEQLYKDIPPSFLGREGVPVEELLEGTYKIYTREREENEGVLGIRIELVY